KIRHSSLFVVYLGPPNYSPHALIGEFLATTGVIKLVLTGPSIFGNGENALKQVAGLFKIKDS
ncbi:MAG: hypothetical protein R3221_12465, partial [Spongiibacter sp.]|nr:hypothetical protein [Spongiibacter sp.]